MASYEPSRVSAYSEDLRWRMAWQVEALRYPHDRWLITLDRSTVSRTIQLFCTSVSVSKKQYPKEKAFRKITMLAQLLILHLIVQKPGIYLRKIQEEVLNTLMIEVDIGTICRFLYQSGFTHQKLCLVATQRDEFVRQNFIQDVSVYDPDMLIFLDETGADRRDTLRKHAYSVQGMPLQIQNFLVRGECLSGLAIMSVYSLLDGSISKGTTDGDVFFMTLYNLTFFATCYHLMVSIPIAWLLWTTVLYIT